MPGEIESQYDKPKNTAAKTAKLICLALSDTSPKKGTTPISNDTVAVRGVAKSGPIDKYSNTENATPYHGATREAKSCTSREPE